MAMGKIFDLEERTLLFSKNVLKLCKSIKVTKINTDILKQLIRSGTSIGANYREANDSLGKKDFLFRLRISRKEAKETTYWLELLKSVEDNFSSEIKELILEVQELRNILSAIIKKSTK